MAYKLLASAALVLGLFSTSFAGTPKGDAKDIKAEIPTEAVSEAGDVLYYFPISDDGATFSSTTVSASQNTPQCNGLSLQYCASGLTASQVNISGGNATVKSGVTPADGSRTHKN